MTKRERIAEEKGAQRRMQACALCADGRLKAGATVWSPLRQNSDPISLRTFSGCSSALAPFFLSFSFFFNLEPRRSRMASQGAVADAPAGLDDAGVAAVAVGEARGNVLERASAWRPESSGTKRLWRRAWRLSRLPRVIICSTMGRAAFGAGAGVDALLQSRW